MVALDGGRRRRCRWGRDCRRSGHSTERQLVERRRCWPRQSEWPRRGALVKRALVLLGLLAACKSPSPPTTFGVNVTVDARMVAAGVRSQIRQAALSITGDETYTRNFDITAAAATGEIRFRYIPGI